MPVLSENCIAIELKGTYETKELTLDVIRANTHSLTVDGEILKDIPDDAVLTNVTLSRNGRVIPIGACRLTSADSPFDVGRQLVLLDDVVDFSSLSRRGIVVPLRQRFSQLPLIFGHKKLIRPNFREYTADLVYDLEVYRGLFDEIDKSIRGESEASRKMIREVVVETEGPKFFTWFDEKLKELETLVSDFSRQEHERHGFYLRKHIRGAITSSKFLTRTNARPRGSRSTPTKSCTLSVAPMPNMARASWTGTR